MTEEVSYWLNVQTRRKYVYMGHVSNTQYGKKHGGVKNTDLGHLGKCSVSVGKDERALTGRNFLLSSVQVLS